MKIRRLLPAAALGLILGCEGRPQSVSATPLTIEARVALESPIDGAEFEIVDMVSADRDVVARGVVEHGQLQTSISSAWDGPFLLRVFGEGASYQDAAIGFDASFGADAHLSTYFSRGSGDRIVVNALTTLATHLADQFVARGTALADAVDGARRLVAEHLERPIPFDIVTTAGAALDGDATRQLDYPVRVGLFHIGLSRLGAEAAIRGGERREAIPSIRVLEQLLADLDDGVLDGANQGGQILFSNVGREPLGAETLRSDLAAAIARWLDAESLPDGTPSTNPTGLERGPFELPGAFFDLLATNSSALFGAGGGNYDRQGPAINVNTPGGTATLAGDVEIQALAEDPSGVSAFSVEVVDGPDGVLGPDAADFVTNAIRRTLHTERLTDGVHTLLFSAVDGLGNPSRLELPVTVANTGPRVTMTAPARVNNPNMELEIEVVARDVAVASIEVLLDGVVIEEEAEAGSFDYAVHLGVGEVYECDTRHRFRVVATDAIGATTEVVADVVCDANPPVINQLAATYFPEEATLLGGEVSYQGPINRDPAVAGVIRKYATRLHYRPAAGEELEALERANIPYLRFVATDFASPTVLEGSPLSGLVYQYRVRRLTNNGPERDWSPAVRVGREFVVPVAFESLGPELLDGGSIEVDVRVVDEAGNASAETTTRLNLEVRSPPAVVTNCRLSDAIPATADGALYELAGQGWTDALVHDFRLDGVVPENSPVASSYDHRASSLFRDFRIHTSAASARLFATRTTPPEGANCFGVGTRQYMSLRSVGRCRDTPRPADVQPILYDNIHPADAIFFDRTITSGAYLSGPRRAEVYSDGVLLGEDSAPIVLELGATYTTQVQVNFEFSQFRRVLPARWAGRYVLAPHNFSAGSGTPEAAMHPTIVEQLSWLNTPVGQRLFGNTYEYRVTIDQARVGIEPTRADWTSPIYLGEVLLDESCTSGVWTTIHY